MSLTVDEMQARMEQLPETCPSWCRNQHAQAIEEDCTVEEASVHLGPNVGGRSRIGDRASYELWLRANPLGRHHHDIPEIEMETARRASGTGDGSPAWERFSWHLDSGTARVLAAQLLHIADVADFGDC